jgi:hypothetical protein
MQHPNIVRCIDCNVVDGRPYIVMELLDGITLHDRLENLSRDGLLPPLHVVERLIRSTTDALDHGLRPGAPDGCRPLDHRGAGGDAGLHEPGAGLRSPGRRPL